MNKAQKPQRLRCRLNFHRCGEWLNFGRERFDGVYMRLQVRRCEDCYELMTRWVRDSQQTDIPWPIGPVSHNKSDIPGRDVE